MVICVVYCVYRVLIVLYVNTHPPTLEETMAELNGDCPSVQTLFCCLLRSYSVGGFGVCGVYINAHNNFLVHCN